MKSNNLLRDFVQGCSTFVLLLFVAVAVFAQQGTSTVRGTVVDQNNNVVPGASVTLTNVGTGATRTATTTDAGVYVFDLIAIGDYKIEVEATGFKKKAVTDIHALIAKSVTVDVGLDVGNVAETVTINIDTGVVPSLRHEWSVLRSTTRSPERTRVSCVSVM